VQVFELRKKILEEEHLDTLNSMANLGLAYRKKRRLEDTEELEVQVSIRLEEGGTRS
jgi:hypothetical protein